MIVNFDQTCPTSIRSCSGSVAGLRLISFCGFETDFPARTRATAADKCQPCDILDIVRNLEFCMIRKQISALTSGGNMLKRVSILNHVIGPIMRGPSSSHTAGPWRIGRTARDLLGSKPEEAVFTFDPASSLAVCYHDQGSDAAFLAGLLDMP